MIQGPDQIQSKINQSIVRFMQDINQLSDSPENKAQAFILAKTFVENIKNLMSKTELKNITLNQEMANGATLYEFLEEKTLPKIIDALQLLAKDKFKFAPAEFKAQKNKLSEKLESIRASEPDKYALGKILLNDLRPVGSKNDQTHTSTYGWLFKSADAKSNDGQTTSMNITFLGTGSMPYFGEHQVMSAGGDVLCQLALQKAIVDKQPSIIIKGVGTKKLEQQHSLDFYPVEALLNPKTEYAGGVGGSAFGKGMARRMKITMEEFYIPNLLKMIITNKDQALAAPKIYDVNIIGHSRGAITAFQMATCIDAWLEYIKKNKDKVDLKKIAILCDLPEKEVKEAIEKIQNNTVDCHLHLLAFDPVEGAMRSGDSTSWLGIDAIIAVNVDGIGAPLMTNCSAMPARVVEAQTFIAESERRWDFRPSIPSFAANTDISFKVQLSNHSTMTGNIGNDDGTALYGSLQNNAFAKEAALATIDKARLDSNRVLFGDHLPPLQTHLLNRIFRSKEDKLYSYQMAAQFITAKLVEKYQQDKTFREWIEGKTAVEKNAIAYGPEMIFQQNPQLLVAGSEWLMTHDQKFTQQVYFLVEKDIHDIYLNPKNKEHKTALSAWQADLKADSSTLGVGLLSKHVYKLGTQPAKDVRQIYLRRGTYGFKSLYELLPNFAPANEHATPMGGEQMHQFANPYHIIISDVLRLDPALMLNDEVLELNLAFAAMNELVLKQAQHMHYHGVVNRNPSAQLQAAIINYVDHIFTCTKLSPQQQQIAKTQLVHYLAVTHKIMSVDELKNFILKETENHIGSTQTIVSNLQTKASKELKICIIKAKILLNKAPQNYTSTDSLIGLLNGFSTDLASDPTKVFAVAKKFNEMKIILLSGYTRYVSYTYDWKGLLPEIENNMKLINNFEAEIHKVQPLAGPVSVPANKLAKK